MLNYYRRFLPAAAKILKPLTEVLRGNVACNKRLTWSPEMSASFAASKHLLVEAVPLAHPDPTARILVAAAAYDTHIGGVLEQVENGSNRPLGFFSRKLSPTEMRYKAFDRELLAAHDTIKHFLPLLEAVPALDRPQAPGCRIFFPHHPHPDSQTAANGLYI